MHRAEYLDAIEVFQFERGCHYLEVDHTPGQSRVVCDIEHAEDDGII